MVAAPAVGAGLLMAFSRTLWSYATITEVYALNALLIVIIFFLMLRWRRRIVEDRMHISTTANAGQVTRHDAFLYSAALIFGLALGVHHVTVALTLPAIAVIVFQNPGREVLYQQTIGLCRIDFNCRTRWPFMLTCHLQLRARLSLTGAIRVRCRKYGGI